MRPWTVCALALFISLTWAYAYPRPKRILMPSYFRRMIAEAKERSKNVHKRTILLPSSIQKILNGKRAYSFEAMEKRTAQEIPLSRLLYKVKRGLVQSQLSQYNQLKNKMGDSQQNESYMKL